MKITLLLSGLAHNTGHTTEKTSIFARRGYLPGARPAHARRTTFVLSILL